MAPVMIAIDTNLLVYAHRNRTPEHRSAVAAIERAVALLQRLGDRTPLDWRILERRYPPELPTAPIDTRGCPGVSRHPPRDWPGGDVGSRSGFGERLISAATSLGVSGARIFDLQIALLAFEGGATELWSHDANFMSLPGLPVHDPLRH